MLDKSKDSLSAISGVEMGDKVYDIRAGGMLWVAIGEEVNRTPRAGLQQPDCLSVMLCASGVGTDPAEIPHKGLSLYEAGGDTAIGGEGVWFLNLSTPAGGLTLLELSTEQA